MKKSNFVGTVTQSSQLNPNYLYLLLFSSQKICYIENNETH